MNNYKVLIIEDHPMMRFNYRNALSEVESEEQCSFSIEQACNCKEAYLLIEEQKAQNKEVDLVFLDISLPNCIEHNLFSGEDIGVLLREKLPMAKIIVSTSLEDNYRISNILSLITPESILLKSEFDIEDLIKSIKNVLKNQKYYSSKIGKIIDNLISSKNQIIDNIDRQLIFELSIGSKVSDIVNTLSISKGNINMRKRKIKELLNANTDRDLILKAKQEGFI